MYAALRAMQEALDRPELPLVTANAIFLAPVPPGPVKIDVDVLRDGRNASQVAADVHVPGAGPALRVHGVFGTRARHAPRVPGRRRSPRCRCPHQITPPDAHRPSEPVRRDPVPPADRVAAGEPARRSRPGPLRVVGAARHRTAPRRRLARPALARSARRRPRPRGRARARPAATCRRWCCRSRSASASSRHP